MAVYYSDIPDNYDDFDEEKFWAHSAVSELGWPDDVVRQWLFEHMANEYFRRDYARLDLAGISWSLDLVSREVFQEIETGPSDDGCIEEYAEMPEFWLNRKAYFRPEVRTEWDVRGTWMVPPILVSRALLSPLVGGLQLVEGRTRVGILKGRMREGLRVAERHEAWVGRPRRA